MFKNPPFQINGKIFKKSQEISRELGILSGAKLTPVPIKLRRNNKIKTIQSSLSIEGNTLSIDQITDIIEGKKIIGPSKDIIEVNNAIQVYNNLKKWDPLSIKSLKEAHKLLMRNLIADNGQFRFKNVGIFKNTKVVHVAPSSKRVPELVEHLFCFIKTNKDISWLLKACIFHYELEFIHPFQDGNGRIGRLWQQLLLMKEDPVFEFISVESIIKSYQKEYYKVLEKCDKLGESTLFIEFSLNIILVALQKYTDSILPQVKDTISRLEYAQNLMNKRWFTRKEYVNFQKNISTATASRDLQRGIEESILIKEGNINQSRYKFKK